MLTAPHQEPGRQVLLQPHLASAYAAADLGVDRISAPQHVQPSPQHQLHLQQALAAAGMSGGGGGPQREMLRASASHSALQQGHASQPSAPRVGDGGAAAPPPTAPVAAIRIQAPTHPGPGAAAPSPGRADGLSSTRSLSGNLDIPQRPPPQLSRHSSSSSRSLPRIPKLGTAQTYNPVTGVRTLGSGAPTTNAAAKAAAAQQQFAQQLAAINAATAGGSQQQLLQMQHEVLLTALMAQQQQQHDVCFPIDQRVGSIQALLAQHHPSPGLTQPQFVGSAPGPHVYPTPPIHMPRALPNKPDFANFPFVGVSSPVPMEGPRHFASRPAVVRRGSAGPEMAGGGGGAGGSSPPLPPPEREDEDVGALLTEIGSDLARHGISLEYAVERGWLGTVSPAAGAVLAHAHASESERMRRRSAMGIGIGIGGGGCGAATAGGAHGCSPPPGVVAVPPGSLGSNSDVLSTSSFTAHTPLASKAASQPDAYSLAYEGAPSHVYDTFHQAFDPFGFDDLSIGGAAAANAWAALALADAMPALPAHAAPSRTLSGNPLMGSTAHHMQLRPLRAMNSASFTGMHHHNPHHHQLPGGAHMHGGAGGAGNGSANELLDSHSSSGASGDDVGAASLLVHSLFAGAGGGGAAAAAAAGNPLLARFANLSIGTGFY